MFMLIEKLLASFCLLLLLLLSNNDLLQQFEDYVIELRCEKGRRKKKEISLKICTKQGVNLRMRCGNGNPE
jgi:hypothetical protein